MVSFLDEKGEDITGLQELSDVSTSFFCDPSSWLEADKLEDFLCQIYQLHQSKYPNLMQSVGHEAAQLKAWGVLDNVLNMISEPDTIFHKPQKFLAYFVNVSTAGGQKPGGQRAGASVLGNSGAPALDAPTAVANPAPTGTAMAPHSSSHTPASYRLEIPEELLQHPLALQYVIASFEALPTFMHQPLYKITQQGTSLVVEAASQAPAAAAVSAENVAPPPALPTVSEEGARPASTPATEAAAPAAASPVATARPATSQTATPETVISTAESSSAAAAASQAAASQSATPQAAASQASTSQASTSSVATPPSSTSQAAVSQVVDDPAQDASCDDMSRHTQKPIEAALAASDMQAVRQPLLDMLEKTQATLGGENHHLSLSRGDEMNAHLLKAAADLSILSECFTRARQLIWHLSQNLDTSTSPSGSTPPSKSQALNIKQLFEQFEWQEADERFNKVLFHGVEQLEKAQRLLRPMRRAVEKPPEGDVCRQFDLFDLEK